MNFQLQWLDPIPAPNQTMANPTDFGKSLEKTDKAFNEPSNLSWRQLVGKVWIWLVVWWIISALIFMVTTFIGTLLDAGWPMLAVVFLFIGFLGTFIWNISIAGIYNLFFPKKYYDWSKTFWLLLLTNALLFFILAPLYFIFISQIEALFLILGFHIMFSVFVSACQVEFTANPNYSGSSFMWNILWFVASFLIFSIIYKGFTSWWGDQAYLVMLLPSVLAYAMIPFGAGIREKIYYKLYEMWNNAFYIPSISEIEDKNDPENQTEDEINIWF